MMPAQGFQWDLLNLSLAQAFHVDVYSRLLHTASQLGSLPPASSDPPLGLSIPGQNISQQTNFDPESLFPKLSMTPSCL